MSTAQMILLKRIIELRRENNPEAETLQKLYTKLYGTLADKRS